MNLLNIPGLEIILIKKDILLIKQLKPPFRFSCSDGLLILPKNGRNSGSIVIDANIEPRFVNKINKIFGPISYYICSHGHMDHIAHVHQWENVGAEIYAPNKEAGNLLNLWNFYRCYNFDKMISYEEIEKFGEINKYRNCRKINSYKPGRVLSFDKIDIRTIPLQGHSIGHVGFLLEEERLMHISCLGFDKKSPELDGFGPWYGFKQCSIRQYIKDIQKVRDIFHKKCKLLTSSHSYLVEENDNNPFEYMLQKIKERHMKIQKSLMNLNNFSLRKQNLGYLTNRLC
ncbi:MAG: MBL fold metallo-hydrolase, partial [Promethearchaeota archaeon]